MVAITASLLARCAGGHPNSIPPRGEGLTLTNATANMLTLSGPIVNVFSNGFQIRSTSCGYINIWTNSATVITPSGTKPAIGMNATVTGTGTCATSITATQVTLNSGKVPQHVLTAAYLYSPGGPSGTTSHGRPFRAYASSLTWAETYSGSNVSAAGMKTMYYTNPNRVEPGEALYTSDETTFAHTCSNARIKQTGTTATIYLMNPNAGSMVNLYRQLVKNQLAQQHFDAIFDDEPYDWYALSAMPCNYDSTVWLNAYVNEMNALGHPVFYNGLGNFGANGSLAPAFGLNPGAIGGVAEDCYSSHFHPLLLSGIGWQAMENTELAMQQQRKIFVCYSDNLTTASNAIAIRIYVDASFLLTYSIDTSILWEYFGTASGYTVEPESQLVTLSPVVSTPTSVSALRASTGVYARQYGSCYIAGKPVGACAVVVNSDNVSSHAFPYANYHHTLLLRGGGILDGGTVSSQGPAPPSQIAPLNGVIAFQ